MKRFILLFISAFLISCGGGNNPTTSTKPTLNCLANNTNQTAIDANSIKISVEKITHAIDFRLRVVPAENVVVQLDDQGSCMRTNQDGYVTFTALNSEPHDIHIFSPSGHRWVSEYNVLPGELKSYNIGSDDNIPPPPIGYATLTGSITNKSPGSLINIVVFFPDGKFHQYFATVSANTNTYSVDISFVTKPGLTYPLDIIVLEYQDNPATGDAFVIDTKQYKKLDIATAATVNTNFVTLNIDFTVPKTQQRSPLLNFNSITLPLGLDLKAIHVDASPQAITSSTPFFTLYSQNFNQNTPALDLLLPITFSAYDQFKQSSYQLKLVASPINSTNANSTLKWLYYRTYSTIPGSYTVTPKISVFPTINSNQPADVISWTTIDTNLTQQTIQLYPKEGSVAWLLILDPSATSVKLPTVPKGLTTRLFSNQPFWLQGELYSPATKEVEQYWLSGSTSSP